MEFVSWSSFFCISDMSELRTDIQLLKASSNYWHSRKQIVLLLKCHGLDLSSRIHSFCFHHFFLKRYRFLYHFAWTILPSLLYFKYSEAFVRFWTIPFSVYWTSIGMGWAFDTWLKSCYSGRGWKRTERYPQNERNCEILKGKLHGDFLSLMELYSAISNFHLLLQQTGGQRL